MADTKLTALPALLEASIDPANDIVAGVDISADTTVKMVIQAMINRAAAAITPTGGTMAVTGAVTATSFAGAGTGLTGTAAALTAGTVTTNANLTGPITSVGNATSIASQTGTGNTFAMSASPTFTGTPAAPTQLAGDNTTAIATTAFVSGAVTTAVTGLLKFQGTTDCSANPNYPAAAKGDSYIVSVAGKIGGASGTSVEIGDWYIATAANAGGTEAAVGASWGHMEHNLVGALLAANNLSDLTNAGTARTNLGLGTVATINVGTGVAAALAINVGSAGAPVLFNGALGTPSSGTLTNATGLPISTGVSGLATGIATFLATPSSANLIAAVTDETGTGALVFATSPSLVTPLLGTPTSGTLTNCTADGTNLLGYRGLPQNSNSANYTTVLADAGKHIFHPSADANARTFTIDSNVNVAYPIGTVLTFVNETSQIVSIAITTDTLTLANSTSTGTRSLGQNSIATALKVTSTKWIISGAGLT